MEASQDPIDELEAPPVVTPTAVAPAAPAAPRAIPWVPILVVSLFISVFAFACLTIYGIGREMYGEFFGSTVATNDVDAVDAMAAGDEAPEPDIVAPESMPMLPSDYGIDLDQEPDAGYDPAVAFRILRELDSLHAVPTETTEPDERVAQVQPKTGSQWLPSPRRAAGESQDAMTVAIAIDARIDARLREEGISAAPRADDAEFLRRVYLDLHGHIPTYTRTAKFLGDTRPDKRALLIDELLEHPDFGLRMARYWRDLLLKRDPDKPTLPNEPVFVNWLARQFNRGEGWDRTVRGMLTAEGDEALVGPTFFVLANEDDKQPAPNKIIATTSALFMGIQLQCAECHVHPSVDHWKPDDFWGLAAFFAGTRADRQDAAKGKRGILGTAHVSQSKAAKGRAPGQIAIPDPRTEARTIGTATAHFFESAGQPPETRGVGRRAFASWLASTDNPYFAPAAANRIWSIVMGRGLVEPLDDMRSDNPPTHPELFDLLTTEFVASDFDVRHLLRSICNSQAYQRTSRQVSPNDESATLYARAAIKVLTADMLFDSLAIATGGRVTRDGLASADAKTKTSDRFAPLKSVEFFDQREYDESSSEYTYGIPQLLRLMNRQLTRACDEIGRKEAFAGSRAKSIDRLYMTVYSRRPTASEVRRIDTFLRQSRPASSAQAYSSALWAMLNSAEFFCNH